jgi:hypothetical protein
MLPAAATLATATTGLAAFGSPGRQKQPATLGVPQFYRCKLWKFNDFRDVAGVGT